MTAQNNNFSVEVSSTSAFHILYRDGHGELSFAVEVDDDPRTMFLNPAPSENGRMIDLTDTSVKKRVDLAIERIKSHFEAKGSKVEID